jgi:predicted MFS family arabinose efflux permease
LSIGLVFAVASLGGIAGSLVSAKVHANYRLKQLLVAVSLLSAVIFCFYLFAGNIFLLAAVTALFYAVDPLFHVTTSSYSAVLIPDAIRGRVTSLTRLQVLAAHSLGFFIAGMTLQHLGSTWTISLFAGFLFVLLATVIANRKLSTVEA